MSYYVSCANTFRIDSNVKDSAIVSIFIVAVKTPAPGVWWVALNKKRSILAYTNIHNLHTQEQRKNCALMRSSHNNSKIDGHRRLFFGICWTNRNRHKFTNTLSIIVNLSIMDSIYEPMKFSQLIRVYRKTNHSASKRFESKQRPE